MRKQQVLIQQIIAVKRNNEEKWFIQNMTIKSVLRNKKVMTALFEKYCLLIELNCVDFS